VIEPRESIAAVRVHIDDKIKKLRILYYRYIYVIRASHPPSGLSPLAPPPSLLSFLPSSKINGSLY